jgi:hypothetical protein
VPRAFEQRHAGIETGCSNRPAEGTLLLVQQPMHDHAMQHHHDRILDDPAPHIGQIYDLTGPESADLEHYARVFSEALGRPIRYRDVPLPAWSENLRKAGFPEHVVSHLSAMTELNRQGRYDRMTDAMYKLTGEAPTNMRDFVKLHAAEFERREPTPL